MLLCSRVHFFSSVGKELPYRQATQNVGVICVCVSVSGVYLTSSYYHRRLPLLTTSASPADRHEL